jgi:hypothetical protein
VLSPTERSLRARIGALRLHATHDTNEVSAPGRAAAAAKLEARLVREVDPDLTLSAHERARRVDMARRAHFASLAYKSARSRAKRKASGSDGLPEGAGG